MMHFDESSVSTSRALMRLIRPRNPRPSTMLQRHEIYVTCKGREEEAEEEGEAMTDLLKFFDEDIEWSEQAC